ncbi:MAG: pirin family protein [Burkholderiales bacterium]
MTHGGAFQALGLRADAATLDPYLMVDHFHMKEPTFGPHPHAGFSAITYVFDDSETGVQNRDSAGDRAVIRPGDLHWTLAGAGIVHEEVPFEVGRTVHGLQIFLNLAGKDKFMPAAAIHIDGERMPRIAQAQGAAVKVVFGAYADREQQLAPIVNLPTEATLLDIRLGSGAAFDYPVAPDTTAFLHVVHGSVFSGGQVWNAGDAMAFARTGGELTVLAQSDAQVALFLGRPLREQVVQHGPFVMNNAADLERVVSAYRAGQMGRL